MESGNMLNIYTYTPQRHGRYKQIIFKRKKICFINHFHYKCSNVTIVLVGYNVSASKNNNLVTRISLVILLSLLIKTLMQLRHLMFFVKLQK